MIFHFLIEVDDEHDTVRMQQIFPIMKEQVTFVAAGGWHLLRAQYEEAVTTEEEK